MTHTHQALRYAALKLTLLHTRAFEMSLPTNYVTSSGLTETRKRLAYLKKYAGEFECSTTLTSLFRESLGTGKASCDSKIRF